MGIIGLLFLGFIIYVLIAEGKSEKEQDNLGLILVAIITIITALILIIMAFPELIGL